METEVDLWSVKDAFIEIENNTPSNASRDILQILKSQLDETSKVEDKKRSDTAKKILDDWKVNNPILN